MKIQLKQITRQFTNPFHHLLLTLLPWLPNARSERASYRAVEKVTLWHMSEHSHLHQPHHVYRIYVLVCLLIGNYSENLVLA